ncbi:hypothetical protein [Floridanema aerugineum]|uniref:Uncharacterized protein n=1 Tax=Floridaenema aerugineum BLCC-F46 TaxID=3153654 RepID=A0ABV4X0D1_9CYAN
MFDDGTKKRCDRILNKWEMRSHLKIADKNLASLWRSHFQTRTKSDRILNKWEMRSLLKIADKNLASVAITQRVINSPPNS